MVSVCCCVTSASWSVLYEAADACSAALAWRHHKLSIHTLYSCKHVKEHIVVYMSSHTYYGIVYDNGQSSNKESHV